MATESENLFTFTCICGFQKSKDIVIISLNTKGFGIIQGKKKRKGRSQNKM